MKYTLLWIIKSYWFLIPASKRKRCLFKQNCSQYVYHRAKQKGLLEGLKALNYRYTHCRPGYLILKVEQDKSILISAANVVFKEEEIAPRLLYNH